jgi:hypothetical protein
MGTFERNYNRNDQEIICTFCMDNLKSCRACDDGYKEITPNQLNYTLKELQVCYDTEQLRDLFQDLLDDEYTGLSLGLVIDLIKQRLETLDKLGALDLGQLTWDNPDWTVRELTDNE